jgi:hypothetical protein
VYATSWGLSTIWESSGETAALHSKAMPPKGMTAIGGNAAIDTIRASNLRQELDNFRWIKGYIQQAWRDTRKPIWLVLAVSKADLFWDGTPLQAAGQYYIPAANRKNDSEFSAQLRGLIDYLGQGRMLGRIAVLPVCSLPEQYRLATVNAGVSTFGGLDLPATLLRELVDKIGELCSAEQR